MSEPKKVKLHVIPPEAKATLEFSGAFHKQLVGAYFNFVSKIKTEDFEEIIQHMHKGETDKLAGQKFVDATSLETLLILISNLEKQFTDAGLDKEEEYEMPNED